MKFKSPSKLKFLLVRCFIFIVIAIFFITVIPSTAFAGGRVKNSPPPNSSPMQGSAGIGIEGIQKIVDNGALDIDSEIEITDNPPNTVIGGGNLLDIVQIAADIWQTALPELPKYNIGVGWSDFQLDKSIIANPYSNCFLTSSNGTSIDLAAIYIHGDNNFPKAEQKIAGAEDLDGIILFNNQKDLRLPNGGRILYYLDSNPLNSKMFGRLENFTERQKNDLNYGRSKFGDNKLFSRIGAEENDLVIDVFSVALHEIQHALGLTRVNSNATNKLTSTKIIGTTNFVDTLDLPMKWANLPTTYYKGIDPEYSSLHLGDDLSFDDLFDFSSLLPNPGNRVAQIKANRIATPIALDVVTDRERKCLSAADVLAVATINGYSEINPNPCRTVAGAGSKIPSRPQTKDTKPTIPKINLDIFRSDRFNKKK